MEIRIIECLVQQVSCLLLVHLARSLKTLWVRIHAITHAVEEKGPRFSQSILPFRVVNEEAVLLTRRLMLHGDTKRIVASIHCMTIEFLTALT